LQNVPAVPKRDPRQLRILRMPLNEKMDMTTVANMKSPITFFEVVNRLAMKRTVAKRPRPVAVQCPNIAK